MQQSESRQLSANNPSPSNSSASMAKNYFKSIESQVNKRTGGLDISISPPVLKCDYSLDVNLAITHKQTSGFSDTKLFGLPRGWSFRMSYILNNHIVINGSESYVIDTNNPSGLQYYYQKNIKLESFSPGGYPKLPYDKSQQYAFMLVYLDGHRQYFDPYGKIICYADRFGNHQVYTYDQPDKDISEAALTSVTGVDGQIVIISHSSDKVFIKYPIGKNNSIEFTFVIDPSTGKLSNYIDPVGDMTTLEYNGGITKSGLLSKITFPSKLVNEFEYSTIKYLYSGTTIQQDVVKKVKKTYEGITRTESYNYDPSGNHHNYLGYPTYEVVPGKDVLLQSDDNNYTYATLVSDGITQKLYSFNRLHLQLSLETRNMNGDTIKKETALYYGEGGNNHFPTFKNLPPNYTFPKVQDTTIINDIGDELHSQISTSYDNWGNQLEYCELHEFDSKIKITKEEHTTYDNTFGIVTARETRDYLPDGIISTVPAVSGQINVLTKDKNNIKTSTIGSYDNQIFKPEKVSEYSYDTKGRMVTEQLTWYDPTNKKGIKNSGKTYSYLTNASLNTYDKTEINYLGQETTLKYDLTTGFLISKIAANNTEVEFKYDDLGRLVLKTNELKIQTRWHYDNFDNKMTVINNNGYISSNYYTGFGDCIKKTDNASGGSIERILEENVYNSLGQLEKKIGVLGLNSALTYKYDTQGRMISKTDAEGNITSYKYNSVAKTKLTFLNNIKTCVEYLNYNEKIVKQDFVNLENGKNVLSTQHKFNGLGQKLDSCVGEKGSNWFGQNIKYDLFNKPIKQISSGTDGILQVNELTRDLLNNVLSSSRTLKDKNGTVLSKSNSGKQFYNEISQIIEESNLLGQSKNYIYDTVGNITETSNFSDETVKQEYYANNKLKSKTYKDELGNDVELRYDYDQNSNLITSIVETSKGVAPMNLGYEYTLDGQITKLTYPDGNKIIWTYNKEGFLTSLTDIIGNKTLWNYDPYGKLIELTNKNLNVGVTFAYYSLSDKAVSGKLKSISYSNGTKIDYEYSSFNLISEIKLYNSKNTLLLSVTYEYDQGTGNVLQIGYRSKQIPGVRFNHDNCYKYNGINQLISDLQKDSKNSVISETTFSYDSSGNIINKSIDDGKKTTITYHYDGDSKLISIDIDGAKSTLKYDKNGNLILDEKGNSYTYNVLNQMTSFQATSGSLTTYTYYPNGLRKSKLLDGTDPILYYYDNEKNANIINESQGPSVASYIMTKGQRYIRSVSDGSSVNSQYLINNIKDIIAVLDKHENIANQFDYTAYGDVNAENSLRNIDDNPFLYNSEYYDFESNLFYLRTRYYAPHLMSFTSRDSIIIYNHYSYANGNPIMNNDPSGHISIGAILGIVAAVVALVIISVVAAVVTMGASAVVEGAAAGGAAAGGAVGGAIGGAEGAAAGAAAGSAIAAGGASGAMSGAAVGAATGAAVGTLTGVGAGTGAATGSLIGGALGGAYGIGAAAIAEGTGTAIGAAIGSSVGGYAGALGGAVIGEAVAGSFGATIGATIGGAAGVYSGAVVGGAIGATVELGTAAGGIVGATASAAVATGSVVSSTAAAVTGFLGTVSEYLLPTLALGVAV